MRTAPLPRPASPNRALVTAVILAAACIQPIDDSDAVTDKPTPAAQDASGEEAQVVAVVHQLFEAMRTNDGEMAARTFHPEARLGRASEDGISFEPPDGLISMIAREKDEVYDEPLWDWTVEVDGRLAQMWTKYAFYIGDEFSHCGTDAFQLYKGESGWQITQLVDTMRSEGCWYPPDRVPASTSD